MATMNRTCEACGDAFYQYRGRPAKRCSDCRAGDRYGDVHKAMRANAHQAVGHLCTRCQQVMLEGQAVEPDHLDGGGPNDYAGWAHASCNHKAGAARGNRMRAAAYRAMRSGVVVSQPPTGETSPSKPLPPSMTVPGRPPCARTKEEINALIEETGQPLVCICRTTSSRCW